MSETSGAYQAKPGREASCWAWWCAGLIVGFGLGLGVAAAVLS